jgi:hypothetical protein
MAMPSKAFPDLGCGLGLRPEYYPEILGESSSRRAPDWYEAISENYMGIGGDAAGRALHFLERVRKDHPIVLHGVSMSLGSVDPLDRTYLKQLKALCARIEPAWVSDHLCWTGVDGENLHDLLPLPYNERTIRHVAERIRRAQDFLGRRMLVENVSSYFEYQASEMKEWEFLSEVARRADCGLLLDVNNIYVSGVNHGFDPLDFLRGLPAERVGQIHLAGHSDNGDHLVDTHDAPVCEAVWSLYEEAAKLVGPVSAMVERDANYPAFEELEREVERARSIRAGIARPERRPNGSPQAARQHPAFA